MFNKDTNENIKEAETVIGPSIKVKGNFHGQGNIIIEGEIEGSVKTDNYLLVGEKSIITANVKAKNAKINGKVTGNIQIDEYLEIGNTAIIIGDINAKILSISKGARLNGKCSMNEQGINIEKK
ncbi:polymer-forming cytoskeletal protein [Candidatus Parcubacteria bacterium]|nr:polymer-forming cytoskeletal protein [Candidatus Parcubacteria bacterium]